MAGAFTKDAELKTRAGYLKYLKETSSSKAAPVPEGFSGPFKSTALSDLHIAFEMLKNEKANGLSRAQARDWFRAAGWCVSSDTMNAWLATTETGKQGLVKIDPGMKGVDRQLDDARVGGTYRLEELLSLHEQLLKTESNSGGITELTGALKRLASGKSKIKRERLVELCSALGGGSDVQFAEVLEMCGITASRDELDCDALAYVFIDKILRPPTSQQLLAMRIETVKQNRADKEAAEVEDAAFAKTAKGPGTF